MEEILKRNRGVKDLRSDWSAFCLQVGLNDHAVQNGSDEEFSLDACAHILAAIHRYLQDSRIKGHL